MAQVPPEMIGPRASSLPARRERGSWRAELDGSADRGERTSAQVTGVVAAVDGRQIFAPIGDVARLDRAGVTLACPAPTLAGFERHPGEVALVADSWPVPRC
ncbi:MAG: hypothetical protein M0T79_15390 [Actinomycetota bacterium]|nr:hypothetical protein [Actinomycetota bacterium]